MKNKLTATEKEEIINNYLRKEDISKKTTLVFDYVMGYILWGGLTIGNITIAGMFSYIVGVKQTPNGVSLLVVSIVSSIIFSYMFMKHVVDYNKKSRGK